MPILILTMESTMLLIESCVLLLSLKLANLKVTVVLKDLVIPPHHPPIITDHHLIKEMMTELKAPLELALFLPPPTLTLFLNLLTINTTFLPPLNKVMTFYLNVKLLCSTVNNKCMRNNEAHSSQLQVLVLHCDAW
ncbi:hypothetical protein Tco_1420359 [Tanacetum coccineum]